jgi:hypothetical protein
MSSSAIASRIAENASWPTGSSGDRKQGVSSHIPSMESRGGEDVDIDGLGTVERHVFQFLVFKDHVVVLAPLIAFHLVVFLDFLAGDGVDVVTDDAVVPISIMTVSVC